MKILILAIIFNFLSLNIVYSQNITNNNEILKGHAIIKIKKEYSQFCFNDGVNIPSLSKALNTINSKSCIKKFPLSKPPLTEYNRYGEKLVDLSLIYEVCFDEKIPVMKVIKQLEDSDVLEYAVPCVIPVSLYVPSDPGSNSQYHLKLIKAFQSWDISKGDTSIVIGIVDTGTEWSHVDLTGNIKYNYNDPPDGIDNDNDGYIDNFRGWDIGDNDNNPMYDTDPHGVHVSGISSATTDNGIGIAGVGFKCKFLPVKVLDSNNLFIHSYEGIVYAAEHGCNIINCSWGGLMSPGQYGQDIINYAVFNHNAVVVAACGNDNNESPYYPASLDNVISVAATDMNDIKNTTSSYGIYVDLCAPGKNIFSTWTEGTYVNYSGTSMSAPIISACAAIVKSVFPYYSALQIGEQLRVTTDKIDTIPANVLFQNKLGSGRVNLLRALTETSPSVRIISINKEDNNDNIYKSGDTVIISASFRNYLAPVNNLSVQISSNSPYINIIQDNSFLGNISSMNITNNYSNPFKIVVLSGITNMPSNVEIQIHYSADNYSSFEYFTLPLNNDYIDITGGLTELTATGRGKIGFNDYYNSEGIGVKYRKGKNIVFCGGLILGSSQDFVSDNVYNETGGYNEDFLSITSIANSKFVGNDFIKYNNIFTDIQPGTSNMGLEIAQNIKSFTNIDSSKFIIFDYVIKNKGQAKLTDFYAALFMDWDIYNCYANRTLWDEQLNMSYSFPINGGIYAGIMLLYPENAKTYAFDTDGSSNSIEIYDGFSDVEKYTALSTNRNSAGLEAGGNDIASMVSSGPFTINVDDSVNIAFAILAGDNYYDIKNSAIMAKDKYYNISNINNHTANNLNLEISIYPNPVTNSFNINLNLPESGNISIKLLNTIGYTVDVLLSKYLTEGIYNFQFNKGNLPDGLYFCEIRSDKISKTVKFIKQ